jgi:hypothetical protein
MNLSSPGARRLRAAMVLVPVAAALLLTVFAWPAARLAPHDLPVGIAGRGDSVAQIERQLAAQDGAFAVHRYPDEAAAREAIADREIYGAFVATAAGTRTLTAGAAGPAVAQRLQAGVPGAPAETIDVAPSPDGDPRGAGFAASALPLMMLGMLAGAAATFLAPAGLRRAGMAVTSAAATGLVVTGILQGWLGVLDGDPAANWTALTLTIASVALVAAGLGTLLGRAGLLATAVLMVVIANAFSAMSSAPELLPQPLGTIGQLLPAGAGGSLLRSTAFFDGAGGVGPAAVLVTWSVLGIGALLIGVRRDRTVTHAAAQAHT